MAPEWYVRKPIKVQAVQLTKENGEEVSEWIRESGQGARYLSDGRIDILGLHNIGWTRTVPGDWIVLGATGEFYPRKDDVFTQLYTPVKAKPIEE